VEIKERKEKEEEEKAEASPMTKGAMRGEQEATNQTQNKQKRRRDETGKY
jgi:hypothetical protein